MIIPVIVHVLLECDCLKGWVAEPLADVLRQLRLP